MLDSIFILLSIFAFISFLLALTNMVSLEKNTRVLVMVMAFLLFLALAFSSFNIEKTYCEYDTGWQCTAKSLNDPALAAIMLFFLAVAAIFIMLSALNLIP